MARFTLNCVRSNIKAFPDPVTGELRDLKDSDSEELAAFTWSPTGERIAATGRKFTGYLAEKSIAVWDTTTGKMILKRKMMLGYFSDLAWSPDGNYLAAADLVYDVVFILDAATGQEIAKIPKSSPNLVSWSPDGKLLAIGNGACGIDFIESPSWQPHASYSQTIPTYCYASAWNPNGTIFLTADDTRLRYLDPNTGRTLKVTEIPGRVHAVTWSPDGSQIAYGYVHLAEDWIQTNSPVLFAAPPDISAATPVP